MQVGAPQKTKNGCEMKKVTTLLKKKGYRPSYRLQSKNKALSDGKDALRKWNHERVSLAIRELQKDQTPAEHLDLEKPYWLVMGTPYRSPFPPGPGGRSREPEYPPIMMGFKPQDTANTAIHWQDITALCEKRFAQKTKILVTSNGPRRKKRAPTLHMNHQSPIAKFIANEEDIQGDNEHYSRSDFEKKIKDGSLESINQRLVHCNWSYSGRSLIMFYMSQALMTFDVRRSKRRVKKSVPEDWATFFGDHAHAIWHSGVRFHVPFESLPVYDHRYFVYSSMLEVLKEQGFESVQLYYEFFEAYPKAYADKMLFTRIDQECLDPLRHKWALQKALHQVDALEDKKKDSVGSTSGGQEGVVKSSAKSGSKVRL